MATATLALGHQVHAVLRLEGQPALLREHSSVPSSSAQPDLFDRVQAVALEEPIPSFLHSALVCHVACRSADQLMIQSCRSYVRMANIRLAITPRPVLQSDRWPAAANGGARRPVWVPAPAGADPHHDRGRAHASSRHIVLGTSFTDWMRRTGVSHRQLWAAGLCNARSSQQLDRLLACEWMIRWDNEDRPAATEEFAVKEVKLTNDYAGVNGRNGGTSSREIHAY